MNKRVGLFDLNTHDYHFTERGDSNPFMIATILLGVLLVVAVGGFGWSFMQMTDWKNNGQQKIDAAVKTAKEEQKKTDDAAFAEEEKNPYLTYQGPADLGSVKFSYPKTWSMYVDSSVSGGNLSLYLNPVSIPKVGSGNTAYALRVTVDQSDYSSALNQYKGKISDGKVTANTINVGKTDKFAGYEGVRVDGQLTDTINGSVSIFKVRDKTLSIYVDSQDFMNDYNNIILKTLSFEP